MKSKKIIYMIASLVVLLSFAACQAAPTPTAVPLLPRPAPVVAATTAPAATTAQAATSAPVATKPPAATTALAVTKGGILRVGTITDVQPVTPHRTLAANSPWLLAIYDTLTRYDNKLQPQPVLAENWSMSADGKQLTMKVRKGVKFHNGREMTAEDVELNFKHLAETKANSQMKPTMDNIASFDRPDPYTLVINFKDVTTNFWDTTERMTIVDPKAIAGIEGGSGPQVGTGPFMWKQYVPSSKIVMERNPNYWQAGQPNLDGIEVNIVPDISALAMNLESNALDMAVNPDIADVVRFQKDSKYRVLAATNQAPVMVLGFNTKAKPFDDKRVRQAFNYALPRQRFVDTILNGLSFPMALPWPKSSPAYDAKLDQSYGYDIAKAAALIKEAGITPGAISLEYPTAWSQSKQFAILYEKELATLGFKVSIEAVETANAQTKLSNKGYKNLYMVTSELNAMYPTTLLSTAVPWAAGNNAGDFRSQAYEDLVGKSVSELDPKKQADNFAQINQIMIDESFIMPISYIPAFWTMSSKVNGLQTTTTNIMNYNSVSMAK
jgi:peptide/nickel transport system substrate-binding protein